MFQVSAVDLRQLMHDPDLKEARRPFHALAHWFRLHYGTPLFDKQHPPPPHLQDLDCDPTTCTVIPWKDRLCLLMSPSEESARVGTNFRVYSVGGMEDVYLMGGHRLDRSFLRNTDFFAFSFNLKKMVPRPRTLGEPRVHHGVATSNRYIYVTGGEYENQTSTNR